jgi:hypothetical protein
MRHNGDMLLNTNDLPEDAGNYNVSLFKPDPAIGAQMLLRAEAHLVSHLA